MQLLFSLPHTAIEDDLQYCSTKEMTKGIPQISCPKNHEGFHFMDNLLICDL